MTSGMTSWLAERRSLSPDATALLHGNLQMSWRQLASRAARDAGFLHAAGIARGHHVALQLGDSALENVCWLHALWWLGAVPVPLGAALPAARGEVLPGHLRIDARVDLHDGLVRSGAAPPMELAAAGTADPIPPAEIPPGQTCSVLLTSGSSSAPKAVPMTREQHCASVRAIARRLGLEASDRWLCCLPLEHVGGLAILIRSVLTGAGVCLQDRFEPGRVAAALREQDITRLSLVPTMLGDLLAAHDGRFETRLLSVLVGGAAAPPGLLAEARERGLPVLPTWGMTEAGSQLATPTPDDAARIDFTQDPGWVGPPLSGVAVKIGPDGRLHVRGPMLFSGYLGESRPELEAGPDRQGWFATGDLGEMDERGHLHILGRIGGMIISGGINVSLAQLEARLRGSGLVRDIALAPVDDARWGQRVVAIFTPESGADAEALQAWCKAHLAPAERPVEWLEARHLPRNAAGKLPMEELLKLRRRSV